MNMYQVNNSNNFYPCDRIEDQSTQYTSNIYGYFNNNTPSMDHYTANQHHSQIKNFANNMMMTSTQYQNSRNLYSQQQQQSRQQHKPLGLIDLNRVSYHNNSSNMDCGMTFDRQVYISQMEELMQKQASYQAKQALKKHNMMNNGNGNNGGRIGYQNENFGANTKRAGYSNGKNMLNAANTSGGTTRGTNTNQNDNNAIDVSRFFCSEKAFEVKKEKKILRLMPYLEKHIESLFDGY